MKKEFGAFKIYFFKKHLRKVFLSLFFETFAFIYEFCIAGISFWINKASSKRLYAS